MILDLIVFALMSLLILEGLTWPGGTAEGFSWEADAGQSYRLEMRGAEALARLLMGASGRPSSGRIIFKGEDISSLPVWERARKGLFFAWASRAALPGLSPTALLRAGLEARRPQSEGRKTLRSFLAERGRALGLDESVLSEAWDQTAELGTAWKFSLLAADCLQPEFTIFCPPDEPSAKVLRGRPGNNLILTEKP
jgi:hypothetical protein